MASRWVDWIWNVRGSVALPPGQSGADAIARLDPLFRQPGTTHEREGNTITFSKKDQAAQDRMSVFDEGTLHVEQGADGPVLRYALFSRALLFCFLAPLIFLSFAGLTTVIVQHRQAAAEAAKKAGHAEPKKPKKEIADVPMNPIDKMLGAPEPEKKKDKNKKEEGGTGDEEGGGKRKPSTTPAFVFASFFAILYLVGRLLEARLVRSLFRRTLAGA